MRLQLIRVIPVALAIAVLSAATAFAAVNVHAEGAAPNRGVGGARLNQSDDAAAKRMGVARAGKPVRDANYAGRAVWIWSFGRKMSDGRYPIRMYAYDNSSDTVFHFTVNSSAYKTTSGVGVGSRASDLKSRVSISQVSKGSVYTIYRVKYKGGKPFSDFAVRNSSKRVHHIDIYR